MSYADDLAKDRDKYRRQRNQLGRHLRTLVDAYGGSDPARDAPILKDARKALANIFDAEEAAAERLLGRISG